MLSTVIDVNSMSICEERRRMYIALWF